MTADAKVGLLLGLFFIVIIAFLVNGLPNFIKQENTTTADVSITTEETGPDIALDNRVSDTINHRLYPDRERRRQTPILEEPVQLDPQRGTEERVDTSDHAVPPQPPVVVHHEERIDNPQPGGQPVAPAPARVRIHVVKAGEILPVIAKKYYGPEEGNRRIVVQKLYEANKAVLKSPDRVRVGDKLVIPLREELLNTAETPNPSERLLREHSDLLERADNRNSRSVTEYVVQKGDSLWDIAETRLGKGNRYSEILTLNKDRIQSAKNLREGMKLRIPPK